MSRRRRRPDRYEPVKSPGLWIAVTIILAAGWWIFTQWHFVPNLTSYAQRHPASASGVLDSGPLDANGKDRPSEKPSDKPSEPKTPAEQFAALAATPSCKNSSEDAAIVVAYSQENVNDNGRYKSDDIAAKVQGVIKKVSTTCGQEYASDFTSSVLTYPGVPQHTSSLILAYLDPNADPPKWTTNPEQRGQYTMFFPFDGFTTPDGNIHCAFFTRDTGERVECEVTNSTEGAKVMHINWAWDVTVNGPDYRWWRLGWPVAPYGTIFRYNEVECEVKQDGVICDGPDTSHGDFWISAKGSYYLHDRPQATREAPPAEDDSSDDDARDDSEG